MTLLKKYILLLGIIKVLLQLDKIYELLNNIQFKNDDVKELLKTLFFFTRTSMPV